MSRFKFLELKKEAGEKKPKLSEAPAEFTADYYFSQAMENFKCGNFENALKLFSQTLEEDNSYFEAWANQVWCLIYLGELWEADIWTDRGLERFPDSPDLLSLKGVILARQGKVDEAMAYSDGAIYQEQSLSESTWLARGEILIRSSSKNATHCFQKAIEMAKDNAFILVRIGMAYLDSGQTEKALVYFNKAKLLPITGHLLWLNLGRTHAILGDFESARQYYSYALRANPNLEAAKKALSELKPRGVIEKLINYLKNLFTSS